MVSFKISNYETKRPPQDENAEPKVDNLVNVNPLMDKRKPIARERNQV